MVENIGKRFSLRDYVARRTVYRHIKITIIRIIKKNLVINFLITVIMKYFSVINVEALVCQDRFIL